MLAFRKNGTLALIGVAAVMALCFLSLRPALAQTTTLPATDTSIAATADSSAVVSDTTALAADTSIAGDTGTDTTAAVPDGGVGAGFGGASGSSGTNWAWPLAIAGTMLVAAVLLVRLNRTREE